MCVSFVQEIGKEVSTQETDRYEECLRELAKLLFVSLDGDRGFVGSSTLGVDGQG